MESFLFHSKHKSMENEDDEEIQFNKEEISVNLEQFDSVVKQLGSRLNYTAFAILVKRCCLVRLYLWLFFKFCLIGWRESDL